MAFVSYGKLSKKKRREIDQTKRIAWGSVSPVTKKVAYKKVYNRKKTQHWQGGPPMLGFCYMGFFAASRANFDKPAQVQYNANNVFGVRWNVAAEEAPKQAGG